MRTRSELWSESESGLSMSGPHVTLSANGRGLEARLGREEVLGPLSADEAVRLTEATLGAELVLGAVGEALGLLHGREVLEAAAGLGRLGQQTLLRDLFARALAPHATLRETARTEGGGEGHERQRVREGMREREA